MERQEEFFIRAGKKALRTGGIVLLAHVLAAIFIPLGLYMFGSGGGVLVALAVTIMELSIATVACAILLSLLRSIAIWVFDRYPEWEPYAITWVREQLQLLNIDALFEGQDEGYNFPVSGEDARLQTMTLFDGSKPKVGDIIYSFIDSTPKESEPTPEMLIEQDIVSQADPFGEMFDGRDDEEELEFYASSVFVAKRQLRKLRKYYVPDVNANKHLTKHDLPKFIRRKGNAEG